MSHHGQPSYFLGLVEHFDKPQLTKGGLVPLFSFALEAVIGYHAQ
jgi:hypothetical protein